MDEAVVARDHSVIVDKIEQSDDDVISFFHDVAAHQRDCREREFRIDAGIHDETHRRSTELFVSAEYIMYCR